MKLRLLTFLMATLMTTLGLATDVTFHGTVWFGPDGFQEPAEGYPVTLFSNNPNPDGTPLEVQVLTDENGEYTATLDIEPTGGAFFSVIVEVFDFCTGEILSQTVDLAQGDVGPFEINFEVCQNFNPPPPPVDCEAFFFYEQISVDPYTVQFMNLSFSSSDVAAWHWDFGDGHTSSEVNPLHDYAAVGIYEVSLTIEMDTCESTFVLPIEVLEDIGCVCDVVYDPVCVLDPATGEILEFSNACVAECEGYGPDSFVDCGDDPCGCAAFFGPPVCVILDDGTIHTFLNECYAMCEGYGPDQYFYCDNPDGCFAGFWVGYPDDPASLVIHYEDNSFSSQGEIITWEWDFGDGNTSTEQNPSHEYGAAGIYEVTLTIVTEEGCTASATQHVCVGFFDDCVCPDVFDPVCVELGSGVLFFPNLCEAECAGFTAADVVDCPDEPCDCPEYYDPVCVIGPNGDIIQFDNICFALCEGYGPDSFVDCENDCNCYLEYDPVCVLGPNGNIITFSNACFAECAGYGPDSYVDCEDDCVCPDIYDPVCVMTGFGIILTFDNACYAACEGYGPDSFVDCEDDCICPAIYDPVCVIAPNGDIITFENACVAECAGYGPDSYVDCEDDCVCPDIYDPVCVVGPNGNIITFSNACEAACEGYGPDSFVDCEDDCVCPDIYDPVCVITPFGIIIAFDNACYAECAGYGPDSYVDCEDDCVCPDIYDPVCVVGPNGNIITFSNACEAECAGFGPDAYVDCEDDCVCPAIYDPVCVIAPNGDIITFPNACVAECAGYGPDSYVDCEDDCVCPDVYDPVCVVAPNGNIITFSNACEAECAGFGPDSFVDCGNDCPCPDIFDPVCVYTAGAVLFFPNACHAECAGYGPDSHMDCEDGGSPCHAFFTIEQEDPDALIVNFIDGSETEGGTIEGWLWDFGDGSTSEEQNPEHEYAEEGIYEVTLTITTSEGCTSTFAQHICIGGGGVFGGPDCQAMFFFEQNSDDLTTFSFFDMSIGDVTSWSWDFGDGNSSEEQNPVHTYADPGLYIVTLTVSTADCESSAVMLLISNEDIWYNNQCVALFLPLIIPDANQVFFLNLSSQDAVSYEWDFGDGNTSNEFIVIHEYAEAGTYEVSLTITTADGCTNTFSVTLDLDGDNFTANPAYLTLTDTDEPTSLEEVRLYPNPAIDDLIIGFKAMEAENYQLEILHANGQMLQRHQIKSNVGENMTNLDIDQLTAGLYLLRISTHSETKTLKFIKQ